MRRHPVLQIVMHCSAQGWGDWALIDNQHRTERRYKAGGYNGVVLNGHRRRGVYMRIDDGLFEKGRDLDDDGDWLEEVGAHAEGFNRWTIGICLIGLDIDDFTFRQLATAARMVAQLCRQFDLDPLAPVTGPLAEEAGRLIGTLPLQVAGHRELPDPNRPGRLVAKLCPVIDMAEFRRQVVIAGTPGGVTVYERSEV